MFRQDAGVQLVEDRRVWMQDPQSDELGVPQTQDVNQPNVHPGLKLINGRREIIGGSMGIGFASSIDPQNGRSSPALGQFFTIMLTLLFLSVDGHLVLVQLLVKSYETMPPGSWISTDRLKDIAFFGGYAFLAGLLLALPVGFLLLCLNLVVGMVSRAAPSLNLFSVGLPASLAVGVVALAVAFPAMGDYMLVIIREGLAATDTLVNG